MHYHRVYSYVLKKSNISNYAFLELIVNHSVATVFYYYYLFMKGFDIG